ncbi:hypothetical protein LF817_16170 [Halobacillus sp. A1]|uniref:hypothetical protein n=1 Tax=Halobacillus sp. A1 TaxID=2880262 RepID=UPI0020A6D695|nr:hypothetical protein [Halobacillus sp. A1]MCP3032863.1 hypothetical protein [Halobacillus sp. A1]
MSYLAKTKRVVQLLFLIFAVRSMFTYTDYPVMYYFLIPFSIFILATIFMNFKLKIVNGFLTFQILIFTFAVYKKQVNHSQIESMKFKRIGWGKKRVIVKNNHGFNFRISNFYPEEIYKDLMDFANEYNVPISKTKDYLILEKLN